MKLRSGNQTYTLNQYRESQNPVYDQEPVKLLFTTRLHFAFILLLSCMILCFYLILHFDAIYKQYNKQINSNRQLIADGFVMASSSSTKHALGYLENGSERIHVHSVAHLVMCFVSHRRLCIHQKRIQMRDYLPERLQHAIQSLYICKLISIYSSFKCKISNLTILPDFLLTIHLQTNPVHSMLCMVGRRT